MTRSSMMKRCRELGLSVNASTSIAELKRLLKIKGKSRQKKGPVSRWKKCVLTKDGRENPERFFPEWMKDVVIVSVKLYPIGHDPKKAWLTVEFTGDAPPRPMGRPKTIMAC